MNERVQPASGALAGLKVLDFTWIFVGQLTTSHLSDHGAQVIKVETSQRPDVSRVMRPYKDNQPGLDRSFTFGFVATSKRSLTLNLKNAKAQTLAQRLAIEWADVVIENYSPGTIKKLGIDYEALRKVNPRLIMASISVMGQTGPFKHFEGIGPNGSAAAGIYAATGWPDRDPASPSIAYPDVTEPAIAITAILAALDYRDRTGKGQYLDLSMTELTVNTIAPALLDYYANGNVHHRAGNKLDRAAPHAAFPCLGDDRWCTIGVFSEYEWRALCQATGHEEWLGDPRFATHEARKANEAVLEELVGEWTRQRTAEQVMQTLQAAGVAAGVVQDIEEIEEHDPQLKHRGYFHTADHPVLGSFPYYAGYPYQLSATPEQIRCAPLLGADTEYVCRDILGLSDDEIGDLLADGALD